MAGFTRCIISSEQYDLPAMQAKKEKRIWGIFTDLTFMVNVPKEIAQDGRRKPKLDLQTMS